MPKKTAKKGIVVGVTGGVATGKSTVCFMLQQYGARVVCCDAIAHRALWKNTRTYRAIVKTFGKAIIDQDGRIDRKKLGSIVFKDKKKRILLEEIVHPFVFERVMKYIHDEKDVLILEIPLLYETGFQDRLDGVIVVACSYQEQIKRLMYRNSLSRKDAACKIKAQMPIKKKMKMADWVVHNSHIKQTAKEIKSVWKKITRG